MNSKQFGQAQNPPPPPAFMQCPNLSRLLCMCTLKIKSYIQIQVFQFGQTYNPPFWEMPQNKFWFKKVFQAIWASPEPTISDDIHLRRNWLPIYVVRKIWLHRNVKRTNLETLSLLGVCGCEIIDIIDLISLVQRIGEEIASHGHCTNRWSQSSLWMGDAATGFMI